MQDHFDIRTRCRHIFQPTANTPAHACGSPALHGEQFCYYHHPEHQRVPTRSQRRAQIRARKAARRSFSFPTPTTHAEIQRALGQVTSLLAADQIDLRHAGRLLATLNTAARTFTSSIYST